MTESSIPPMPGSIPRKSDEARMIQAARQDPKAFGELYLLYVEQVFRYLCSLLGNVQEAEDVTAQTFLTAFESFDRFRKDGRFAPWLFTIARNKAMDHFRSRKNLGALNEAESVPVEDDPLSGVIQSEQAAALSKLIRSLPQEEQELLRLRYLAEMSFAEIGHLIHKNEDAVKKSIYRLLARLQSRPEVSGE